MNLGDIVRLKPEIKLSEIITGNCQIDDVVTRYKKTRYHIKSLTDDKMTWVYESEVDMVSNLRNQTLEKLGI
jgi:hypothetical protein